MAENLFFADSINVFKAIKELGFSCIFSPLDYDHSTYRILYVDGYQYYTSKQIEAILNEDVQNDAYDCCI